MNKENLNRHPSEFGVLPFIHYPSNDENTEASILPPDGKIVVTIALHDAMPVNMSWADDSVIGKFPYVPGIDILVDEPEKCQFMFNSEIEAVRFVRNWWATAKCEDYKHFTK